MSDHDLNSGAAVDAPNDLNGSTGLNPVDSTDDDARGTQTETKPTGLFSTGFGREARIAVAVGLSVLLLVSALVVRRYRRSKAETGELAARTEAKKADQAETSHKPPVMTIPAAGNDKAESANDTKSKPKNADEDKRDGAPETSSTEKLPDPPLDSKTEAAAEPKTAAEPPPPKDDAEPAALPTEPVAKLPDLPADDEPKKNQADPKLDAATPTIPVADRNPMKTDPVDSSESAPVPGATEPIASAEPEKPTKPVSAATEPPKSVAADSKADDPLGGSKTEPPSAVAPKTDLAAQPEKPKADSPPTSAAPEPAPPPLKEADAPIVAAETPADLPALPKPEPTEQPPTHPSIELPEPKTEPKPVSAEAAKPNDGEWIVLPNRRKSEPSPTDSPRIERTREPIVDRIVSRPRPSSSDLEGTVVHVVKRGENFWTISRDYYGTGRYYKALWRANRDKFAQPESLFVGASIRVPLPEALDPAWIIRPSSKGSATSARVREIRARRLDNDSSAIDALPVPIPWSARPVRRRAWSVADDGFRLDHPVHRVRQGENLRTIARDFLGDPRRADEIAELNPDRAADAPRVEPGVLLILPDDARGGR